MQLFLVRHGQDLPSKPGYLTDEDTALSEAGKRQAKKCALKIKEAAAAQNILIVTSPRRRTLQTAQILAEALEVAPEAVTLDARLTERDCAAFFGQSTRAVFTLPEADLVRGGMEAYTHLYTRLSALYEEYHSSDSPVVFVTHSGNVRPFIQLTKGVSPDPTAVVQDLPADSYIQLQPQ